MTGAVRRAPILAFVATKDYDSDLSGWTFKRGADTIRLKGGYE